MSRRAPIDELLRRWARIVRRHALTIVLVSLPVSGLFFVYAARNLGVDTDTSALVSEDLDFRRTYGEYRDAFGAVGDELIVLIEAGSPGLAERAARRLGDRLARDTALFESVFAAAGGPFFEAHWPLYRPVDSLARTADRIAESAWLLEPLSRDPTLSGLASALEDAFAFDSVEASGVEAGRDLGPILGMLAGSVAAAAEGRFSPAPWEALLGGGSSAEADRRRLLHLRPRLDFTNRVPGRTAVRRVEAAARALGLVERNGVRVRTTGLVAIESEEIITAVDSARRAGILALVTVGAVLFVAFRSWRLIAASLYTLAVGLGATAALAAVLVGHVNLISVAFAILYVGLGIDYAIHLSLRFRARLAGSPPAAEVRAAEVPAAGAAAAGTSGAAAALEAAVVEVGPSLALSAVTTAACFYAFVPTDLTGVSELGIIGGSGMLVSLIVTLTVLPACLALATPEATSRAKPKAGLPGLARTLRRGRRPVLAGAAALTIAAAFLVPRVRFDHNALNLRDPDSEAIVAYRELLADPRVKPLTIDVLRDGPAGIARLERRVDSLAVAEGVRSLLDFIPEDQARKLSILSRLPELPAPAAGAPEDTTPEDRTPDAATPEAVPPEGAGAVRRLRELASAYRWRAADAERELARALFHALGQWERRVESWPAAQRDAHLEGLRAALIGPLAEQLRRLRAARNAREVTLDRLPDGLVARWRARDGRLRAEILPAGALETTDELRKFVDDVRTVVPDATGGAVNELETGRTAVRAFRGAIAGAGIVTTLLLLAILRDPRAVVLVVAPLAAAGVWTAGITVVAGLPFNFANVIALPLLLGVGVDNGIHMMHQARTSRVAEGPVSTSTGRAVLFASLTTIASFGNLAFAPHPGMASMGRLLTVGMACVLAATLIVLPTLLPRGRRRIPRGFSWVRRDRSLPGVSTSESRRARRSGRTSPW